MSRHITPSVDIVYVRYFSINAYPIEKHRSSGKDTHLASRRRQRHPQKLKNIPETRRHVNVTSRLLDLFHGLCNTTIEFYGMEQR